MLTEKPFGKPRRSSRRSLEDNVKQQALSEEKRILERWTRMKCLRMKSMKYRTELIFHTETVPLEIIGFVVLVLPPGIAKTDQWEVGDIFKQ
jgi:hypothetical protein